MRSSTRRIEGGCHELGWTLTELFERGMSGGIAPADRPEGSRLIARLQPGDAIISPKLDRMVRVARDALNQIQKVQIARCRSVTARRGNATTDGIAKLTMTIPAGVAEWERHRLRERVMEVKAHMKLQAGGRVPFGYLLATRGDETKVIRIDPKPFRMFAANARMRSEGESFGKILDAIKERFPTRL